MIGRDILVNFLGRAWAMLMGVAFVPVYLSTLGTEAYGVIGFYATLQAILIIADFGLSWTITRELAQARAERTDRKRVANLVRTLEVSYWLIAALVSGVVALSGDYLANHWLQASELSANDVEQALHLMGAVLLFQMPSLYYQGVLNGLDQQPATNLIASLSATLRWAGAALVLWLYSSTIQAFFVWQVIAAALGTGITAWTAWRHVPSRFVDGRIDPSILGKVWRFTFGVMASAFAGVLAMQVDKLVLTRLISLEQFGHYSLAVLITSLLTALVTPLHTAFYPRFSEYHATGDVAATARLYDAGTQLLAVLVVPVAFVLVFFPEEILMIWTGNDAIARDAAELVSLLAAGNLVYCLTGIANLLLIAAGWPALSALALAGLAAGILPALIVFVPRFGSHAAAVIWLVACICYLLMIIPTTHRHLLGGRLLYWCTWSVLVPITWATAVFAMARWLLPHDARLSFAILLIGSAWAFATLFLACSLPAIRRRLIALSLPLKAAHLYTRTRR